MEHTTSLTKKTSSESTLRKEKELLKANAFEMIEMIMDINDSLGVPHTEESEFNLWEVIKVIKEL